MLHRCRINWSLPEIRVAVVTASIADFLHVSQRIGTADQEAINGFNGLHGGLAVAALVRQMRMLVPPERELVFVTARFVRPMVWLIVVDADVVRNGTTLTLACATASSESGTSAQADTIFCIRATRDIAVSAPLKPPEVVKRSDAPVVEIPLEFIPISRRVEIRAAAKELPYSGSVDLLLCGWTRLRDAIPSLVFSYTALLTEPKAVQPSRCQYSCQRERPTRSSTGPSCGRERYLLTCTAWCANRSACGRREVCIWLAAPSCGSRGDRNARILPGQVHVPIWAFVPEPVCDPGKTGLWRCFAPPR